MPQEMNQLPIRHTASSSMANTLAGAAGGAITGAAKGALYTFGLIVGLPVAGAIAGALIPGLGVLAGIGLGFVPLAAVAVTGAVAWASATFLGTPLAIGAGIFGALGLVKGGKEAHTRVQEQAANANVLDAQLQAAAMDAQARVMQAQAAAPQRPRYSAPEQFNQASPSIMAGNDNEVHGTVAQAPQRQMGA